MTLKTKKLKDKVNIRDSYNTYNLLSDKPISVMEYCKILNGFFKFLFSLVLEGHEVKLPQSMGSMYIRGIKAKISVGEDGRIRGAAYDWKETNALWERCPECKERKQYVYHLNEHTNGLRYSLKWFKSKISAENIHLYSFQLAKPNKRDITRLIKSGKEYNTEILYSYGQ